MTHDELIGALEAATGPSRELDAQIWWFNDRKAASIVFWNASAGVPKPLSDTIPPGLGRVAVQRYAPEYTKSIDAALTLVPEGWTMARLNENDDKTWACELREGYLTSYSRVVFGPDNHKAKTPAIALCIAALKARG